MKLKLILIFILFLSEKLMGQYTVAQPDVFRLAQNSNIPCPISDIGKIFYYTANDMVLYCRGNASSQNAGSYWKGIQDIYYMGNVSINNGTPSYNLDAFGSAQFKALLVNEKIGINTNTPTEKLELVDRSIFIRSTSDAKLWALANSYTYDRLEFHEDGGIERMYVKYGGIVVIGDTDNLPVTDNLSVKGDASYAGSLSIEGKGILANANTSQLIMNTIRTSSTGTLFFMDDNTCKTKAFSIPSGTFTQAPAVIQGQKIAGNYIDDKLVISIQNVTTTGGVMMFCNNSGGAIYLDNAVFSLIAIGQ